MRPAGPAKRAFPSRSCLFALGLLAFALTALPAETPGVPGSAVGESAEALPYGGAPVPGDWVVYRDRSWPTPTWVGFIYYGDSTWGTFLKTPSAPSDVRILFRTESVEGKLLLTGQRIISTIAQSDVEAVNYLMGLLPEMWEWSVAARAGSASVSASSPAIPGAGSGAVNVDRACAESKTASGETRSPLLPAIFTESRDLPDFGGDVALSWAGEIPVFGLESAMGAAGQALLGLERMGRAVSSDDGFFDFEPLPDTAIHAATSPAAAGPAKAPSIAKDQPDDDVEIRRIDGLDLALGGQWTAYADNTFFMGNDAVLIVAAMDPQSLGPAASGVSAVPLALYGLFTRSNANAWEIPGHRILSGTLDRFRIENLFYDRETETLNRDIKFCVPTVAADGSLTGVKIVSLSVRDAAYRANPGYFDGLLR